MWRNLVLLAKRYGRSETMEVARQSAGLCLDTLICAWTFRDRSILSSSWRGAVAGLAGRPVGVPHLYRATNRPGFMEEG